MLSLKREAARQDMTTKDDLPKNPNYLQRQLELSRFERALEVVDSMVESHAFLNTGELARINQILTGTKSDPWRVEAAICQLPSGRDANFQVLADPINKAKEILRAGKDRADAGDVVDAAADVYAQFVLTHVFQDGNRRTAVIAAYYLLKVHGHDVSALGLHELGLGDLRIENQMEALRQTLRSLIRMKVRSIR